MKRTVLDLARKVRLPTEHDEQTVVVAWARLWSVRYPSLARLFAIPNGAHKSHAQARKFQLEGLRSGVPDLFLPVAASGHHGMFIEMKRRKGGVVSPEQMGWHVALREAGYHVAVCYGAEEAMDRIAEYLGIAHLIL